MDRIHRIRWPRVIVALAVLFVLFAAPIVTAKALTLQTSMEASNGR